MEMGADELQEILAEFHTEAEEGLDELEQDLIKLEALAEAGEFDPDLIDRLFRALHTLKGGAGFLGLEKMAKLAHAGENLLDEVRAERVQVDKPVMDALLETNDGLRALLDISKEGGDDSSEDFSALVGRLEELSLGNAAPAAAAAPAEAEPAPAEPTAEAPTEAPAPAADVEVNEDLLNEVMNDPSLNPEMAAAEAGDEAPAEAEPAPASDVPINEDLLNEVMNDPSLNPEMAAEEKPAAEAPAAAAPVDEPAPAAPAEPTPTVSDEEVVIKRGAPAPELPKRGPDRREGAEERRKAPRRAAPVAEATIRVETGRLDKVMNQVGELVLARNSLMRQLNKPEVRDFLDQLENAQLIHENLEIFSRVTGDLQLSVLGTRMQAVKKVFDKIPRQVRELKSKLGKEVELVIEGEFTEVDKTLVEELADPMVHLIRNALDHGLETPDERLAAGKDATGTLRIAAYYEGNNVIIEVAEDGKGIDPEKIKQIAIGKGIITDAQAAHMPDNEAQRLIMAAGFSTAESISDVSGRGVGMDVVNAKIKEVKGSLDIISTKGKGTTMKISLPLTLAIMQALLVEAQDEGFAIPIGDITEVIRFRAEQIHQVNHQDVIELRGETLPLYYLSQVTQLGISQMPESKGYIIVVKDGGQSIGLVVDQLIGQEEAVVKKVTDLFAHNPAISGATITGDGRVHMILDVPFLLKDLTQKAA